MNSGEGSQLLLRIQYDGSDFLGWQLQPEGRTVQSELERSAARLLEVPVRVLGSGRTDSGVHATGQAASVTVPSRWTAHEFCRAMNAVLPTDVWIESAIEVSHDFHPRYHAVARTYHYRLGTASKAMSPFHRRACWALGRPIDRDALERASACLIGTHSFKSFAKSGQEHRGDVCHVRTACWRDWPGLGVEFTITANRFLHRMVRYLVGTMVTIGLGRRDEDDLPKLLLGKGLPLTTSPPAPPQGLFLAHVEYPAESILPPTSASTTGDRRGIYSIDRKGM